jgi:polysaccharide transporter, PST family
LDSPGTRYPLCPSQQYFSLDMSNPRGLKTDTLVSGIAMLLALTVAQRLIGFGRGVLFCRWLDADQLGQWDLAYGFLMLAAPLAVLGLPGSLGRYVEYYRQRGQLQRFLRRMAIATSGVAAVSIAVVVWRREWFAEWFFNSREHAALVGLLAVVLITWILHTGLVALFNALRMTRVVSGLQFCHSVAFAAIGCAVLIGGDATAAGVVRSFAAAGVLSSLLGAIWLVKSWKCLPQDGLDGDAPAESPPGHRVAAGPFRIVNCILAKLCPSHRDIWRQVLPFALWVWITNALANTFGLADRWMLIHYSGLSEPEALAQVGQYHSARIVSLLFLGLAEMLAGLVTPHLAHDWEAGRREDVSRRLNLILKLFSLCLYSASVVLLLLSPLLFGVALQGKYAAGMALLPWTMAYCIWGSLAVVATNYLWCAERARLASLALIAGLAINIGLNALLLPRFGLFGAVWATSAANFTMLVLMYAAAWSCGMRFHRGTCLAALTPLALAGGLGTASIILLVLVGVAFRGHVLFTIEEQSMLTRTIKASHLAVFRFCSRAGKQEHGLSRPSSNERDGPAMASSDIVGTVFQPDHLQESSL